MATGAFDAGAFRVPLTAITSSPTTAGGVLSLANPEGKTLIITRFILNITSPSAGAATVDAGVAADGSTSSDTLIDGASVATAAKALDSGKDGGTNGKIGQLWTASQFVTVTASATLAGLVGEAIIFYIEA